MRSLGNRIRNLREKANFSQKRLAESLGISNVQLSRYESGERKPDPEMILAIANYFDVSTDYLLGRIDHPPDILKPESEDENLFFFDQENVTPEEAEELRKHLEFLRFKAREYNQQSKD